MLRLCIDRADLGRPWVQRDGSWRSGDSFVTPYAHPALQCVAVQANGELLIAVVERNAGKGLVVSHAAESCDPRAIAELLASIDSWPMDHVVVRITASEGRQGRVWIKAGEWGAAPIYLIGNKQTLRADWNPAALYPHVGRPVFDERLAAHYLLRCGYPYAKQTIIPEIQMLTTCASASWEPGQPVRITYSEPAPRHLPRPVVEGADVVGTLGKILMAATARWIDPSLDAPVSAELSSGLDTAMVASAAAVVGGRPVRTYGLIMPGEPGRHQRHRRDDLIAQFGFVDLSVDADAFLPFTDLTRIVDNQVYVGQEFFHEAFAQMLRLARSEGTRVLMSGNGGDELCYLNEDEWDDDEWASRRGDIVLERGGLPDYVTDKAFELYHDGLYTIDRAPRARMPRSAFTSSAASAPLYLDHGIWPVSPLATPEIYRFCRSLPRAWRQDRRIQRDWLARLGCSGAVTHPKVTETFQPVVDQALRQAARPLVTRLLANSCLADWGLVDRDRLMRHYERFCAARDDPGEDGELLAIVSLELSFRALSGTGSEILRDLAA